ncbi:hypothetical protein ACQPZZ_32925 [Microbispora sp. CA-135349]|uniref:hypothetical protein n=1 Tax=Microbispora sp. CA-135349 TaxID=3239953 RepID=UPI003D940003
MLLALVAIDNPVARFANGLAVTFPWPGVEVLGVDGRPLKPAVFQFNWLTATGTVVLVAGLISTAALRLPAASPCASTAWPWRESAVPRSLSPC